MLERLVAWVLNNYLGKYVENLNTDQLSVALLQGSVELENLPLKKDAFRHFGLPLNIKYGVIGKIRLKVPVTQLRSAPWVIVVEHLTVVLSPLSLSEWDEEAEELAAHEYKLSLLDSLEASWRTSSNYPQESSYSASSYASWFSCGSGLITNIVENIQLEIKDVNFRYEDDVTTENPFAVGVTIDSLSVQSCNEQWISGYKTCDSADKYSFQLMQLNGLSVYLDIVSGDDFWKTENLDLDNIRNEKHFYIVPPVSAEARIKRNRCQVPLRSRNQPRVVCDLSLESVPICLTDTQYIHIVHCSKGLKRVQKCRKYVSFRPSDKIKDNPKAWWIYILNCHRYKLRGTIEKSVSWDQCQQRARENIVYVKLYSELLSNATGPSITNAELKELKNKVEWERGFEELRILREIAMHRTKSPTLSVQDQFSNTGRSTLFQWFPQWWGWYSTADDQEGSKSNASEKEPTERSEQEAHLESLEDEILDVIADTVENNTILRRDTVFGQFNFTLKEGNFRLCTHGVESEEKKCIMELLFSNVRLELESRPRSSSSRFFIALGSMILNDHLTENSVFPVLISPQSCEEAPSGKANRNIPPTIAKLLSQSSVSPNIVTSKPTEPLFQLVYEYKPFFSICDYKLHVKSQSVDIVYNAAAVRWLFDFFVKPHQESTSEPKKTAKMQYYSMKQKTKEEFLKNWDNILQGHEMNRKEWDIRLDISAPQIFLAENFTDKNTIICIVDFGKLFFTNRQTLSSSVCAPASGPVTQNSTELDITEDDDEAFATPCSTPPGSETSELSDSRRVSFEEISKNKNSVNETNLHSKIYESYKIELNESQVLLGRMKDNWKFAHLKGSSSMHVLDKFNISLQVERRLIYTNDPLYPSLMILGNLPKLIVHANENKIQAIRSIYDTVVGYWAQTPFRTPDTVVIEEFGADLDAEDMEKTDKMDSPLEDESVETKLFMIQFVIDQLALEVQSRGRSIAELQVSGVKALFTKRPVDTSLNLSVHSLLLVDALQTFGPDFELLLASHKHVGMDSISGSLKDSDPTSPVSPGSPDPNVTRQKVTTPSTLLQALSTLTNTDNSTSDSIQLRCGATSPLVDAIPGAAMMSTFADGEALIMVDIVFVKDKRSADKEFFEDMQIASIQFNNLDVVANQETIVELISFTKRVMSQFELNQKYSNIDLSTKATSKASFTCSSPAEDENVSNGSLNDTARRAPVLTKTDLTFDFHRLNILLLRSVTLDNGMTVARKIATATMTNAKIHATVGDDLLVEGSLGGLQVLDLTSEGRIHQRIFSVGQDPLKAERYVLIRDKRTNEMTQPSNNERSEKSFSIPADGVQAMNFIFSKSLTSEHKELRGDMADVKVRFSSALYTHAPHFVAELSNYATEFKQYLKNLARSIGSAATEMALNLVHARAEALAQSVALGHRQSLYNSTLELPFSTPRKQWIRSPSIDLPTDVNTSFGTMSPTDFDTTIKMKLDVVIDSPIIVLPRFATSYEVLVAHLGRISLNNEASDEVTGDHGLLWAVKDRYNIEIRDMNMYSLNVQNRIQNFSFKGDNISLSEDYPPLSIKAADIYDCSSEGKPILHNTVIHLCVERDLQVDGQYASFLDQSKVDDNSESTKISGKISTPLRLSLTRQQYEQLIETFNNVLENTNKSNITAEESSYGEGISQSSFLPNIAEDSELRSGVSALDLDPALRAKMLQRHSSSGLRRALVYDVPMTIYNVDFEIPVFTVELKADFGAGERGLVELSFCDFLMQYEQRNKYETMIQMSLQSLVMEDLQHPPNSKHRFMMVSSVSPVESQTNVDFISTSCPDVSSSFPSETFIPSQTKLANSLPDYLEMETVFGGFDKKSKFKSTQNDSARKSTHRNKSRNDYPCTPPPSPKERRSSNICNEENLVHISVVLYSKDSEQFFTKKLYRTVNVDFNSLNMIVNVQSWIVVLDFFGLADDQMTSTQPTNYSKPSSRRQSIVSASSFIGSESSCIQRSELDISIKSLSLILNRVEYEMAKANISHFNAHIVRDFNVPAIGDFTTMEGHIGSLSLHDMTPLHGKLYSERFLTSGLDFSLKRYSKPDRLFTREYDIDLKLKLPSVTYTHTQRFAYDLQTYYKQFTQLQKIFNSIRSASKASDDWDLPTRVRLDISAAAPVIIIPVSSQHRDVLIIDLGNLSITNSFKWSDSDNQNSDETQICLLDAREIILVNMDLFIGEWRTAKREEKKTLDKSSCDDCLYVGSYVIERRSTSLLQEKCELILQVERNLSDNIYKSVPDMSYTGILSTLAISIDFSQYLLLRGLLMFNIGECLDDLSAHDEEIANSFYQTWDPSGDFVWRTNCLHLDLVNVSVTLLLSNAAYSDDSLACVNFIKSHLSVESFSDKSQDVDLVSQEILLTDTRFLKEPVNKRSNIFTNILQPIGGSYSNDNIRVEVHHRRREDKSNFTILLNDMRLMAILDWWELVRDFVICDVNLDTQGISSSSTQERSPPSQAPPPPVEIKLNITNSEVVLLEDTTLWDSNAVIFKSTTVINFKPHQPEKILSCNLNHCELFSCILGMEDETALSIVDPVTINCELSTRTSDSGDAVKVLQISSHHLYLRLSYHDVRMFLQILKSLPKQTAWGRSKITTIDDIEIPVNMRNQIVKLRNLGFSAKDCMKALEQCHGNLDSAALWLTQNANPVNQFANFLNFAVEDEQDVDRSGFGIADASSVLSFQQLELKTVCLNVCVIDDCQDSDVPLLELSMANLFFQKDLIKSSGQAMCSFSIDYYNRFLSGWEPFLESWSCSTDWSRTSKNDLSPKRFVINIIAQDVMNVNITRTLIDLYQNVKEVWTQDYYNPKEKMEADSYKQVGNSSYRRRSPFVPFALRNETGCLLSISTSVAAGNCELVSSPETSNASKYEEDCVWHTVNPSDTIKFSFEEREKHRHRDSHMTKHHQITVKVHGWKPVKPVSVDRVGVYFRHALPDNCTLDGCDLPQARIVFDVTLEGSARKLITVRSALLLNNHLELPIEVKLENTPSMYTRESQSHTIFIQPGKCEPVPLSYTHAQISLRPMIAEQTSQVYYAFSDPIFWQRAQRPGNMIEETRQCHSNKGSSYRFRAVIRRENYPFDRMVSPSGSSDSIWTHPGHSITFVSPMIIVNLLPYDLYYAANDVESGIIRPSQQMSLHEVNNDMVTEIILHLESYPGSGSILIPSHPSPFTSKLRLQDQSGRKLYLQVAVSVHQGAEVKVTVYSPYWIVNKTALPLVFRQEGVPSETAGQFEEHEIARMVAPLMFSLTDSEASPTIVARIGAGMHPEGIPQWCSPFNLQTGVQVRRLRVCLRGNRPDIVYMIGINVRPGRGRYRNTLIMTLSAHYQIHNKSSFTLQFAQKCFATTVNDPGARATHLQALPNCNLPYHWPRLDKDQLLCLRIVDVPNCLWSGGFRVTNDAFHINVRDRDRKMHFVRVEIVLQDATYFIIFMDAETMPPPLRIDNFTQVDLDFHQMLSDKNCRVRAHSSIPYAWDEPVLPHSLTIIAPGNISADYNVNQLGRAADLTYENFIYIAFSATFNNVSNDGSGFDVLDVQQQQLVLDVLPGTDRVFLNRKENGARSQFWRMTSSGQLQHEGSSPPIDPRSKYRSIPENVLVLDIAGPALQPKEFVSLALRRSSQQRISTQTWRFTEEGRLCCAHNNMCVQARDGFFGLKKGNDVVLGPMISSSLQTTANGVPFEQAIVRQKLRPGSGFLSVNVTTDGPTRVIEITDIQDKKTCALMKDCDWMYVDKIERPAIIQKELFKPNKSKEFDVNIHLEHGIGLSLVSQKPAEELIFARLTGISMNYVRTYNKESLELTIKNTQVDNQLFEAQCDVLLYVMPTTRNTDQEEMFRPAIFVSCERMLNNLSVTSRAEIIKSLFVRIKNLYVILEERLLLKLVAFVGYNDSSEQEKENVEETDFETQQILADLASVHAKRYYFEILELFLGQIRLSVLTSSKLPPPLRAIKKKLRLTLLKFEDATVDMRPFTRFHFFETGRFLVHTIAKHFRNELKWQAATILGSVDFLGNPLGFMNDLSEGVSGLMEGNFGALVQSVTHGLSNSAAKVTETLSDGLGLITMDEQHEDTRRRIRNMRPGTSGDHLVAGFKGLGYGVFGGLTSVFKQTYNGAVNAGPMGILTGFGKGLVGTVTKPVVGMLDLASETASAVRDSSRSSSKVIPHRWRRPRCVMGPTGLLPTYSTKQSLGQDLLYSINKHNYNEVFIAYEVLRCNEDNLQIIISSEEVRIFLRGNSIVYEFHLRDVYLCQPLIQDTGRECRVYIEFYVRTETAAFAFLDDSRSPRPRIRCDNENIAAWVSEQVNYARNMFLERQQTLIPTTDHTTSDD